MKFLAGLRIVLGAILVIGAIPLLILFLTSASQERDMVDTLFALLIILVLLAAYVALSWYTNRLRQRHGIPSLYDKVNTTRLTVLKWVCLGAALFAVLFLYLGINFLHMGMSVGQEVDGYYVTEGNADGFSFGGLIYTYLAAVALSILIPLFVRASLQLRKRERLLHKGEDAV